MTRNVKPMPKPLKRPLRIPNDLAAVRFFEYLTDKIDAFAVFHLVTLTIKDGSLHGSDYSCTVAGELKIPGPSQ